MIHRTRFVFVPLYAGPDADLSPTQSTVVFRNIDESSGWKVGEYLNRFFSQYINAAVNKLIEVVGKNLTGKANGDTFSPLRQQKGKLYRQGNRLLVATIIGRSPTRGLGIEGNLQREFC